MVSHGSSIGKAIHISLFGEFHISFDLYFLLTNSILSIFSSILGQTLAAATREEQNSKTLINLINSTLLKHEKLSNDKRNGS